ncbi:MAG TPA: hypothetical protein DCX19_03045 [Alphaproteobacteria bacterium]|nr:hypothetical protein [Alphaproteobacteria bacterium]
MKKAKDVQEFVERIDATKKVNPKDLSSDQDLTIAIMNLISIEEHLVFSGAKTGKNSFYDLIEEVRELRKTLMQKVIPQYEGEVWCISKHLLASAMRLMEVGTKQQSLGHREDAYKLFGHAYELYCLFWGLNMNMLDTADVKWIEDKREDMAKISEKLEQADVNPAAEKSEAAEAVAEDDAKPASALSKMKAFVRKAVDCCIE